MQIQPRKQKWSKVALHFHINIMLVNLYIQLIYRYGHIHKATIRVATGLHFVLQTRFSETESYTVSMAYSVFCTMVNDDENSFILMAKLSASIRGTHYWNVWWTTCNSPRILIIRCDYQQISYNPFHNLINLHIKTCWNALPCYFH